MREPVSLRQWRSFTSAAVDSAPIAAAPGSSVSSIGADCANAAPANAAAARKMDRRFMAHLRGVGHGAVQPRQTTIRPGGSSRRTIAPTRLGARSEEHTSELQSLMRISYAVFCLKKKKQ